MKTKSSDSGRCLATLADIVGSFVPLTLLGKEWRADACPFEQGAGGFYVSGEKWRCVAHGCHEEHGDNAIGFLRMTGMSEEEAQVELSRGEWEPALQMPERPPSKWSITRAADRPDAPVLVCDSRAAARKAVELLPATYCVCVWPDGRERWALDPLRGRTVLLWPGPAQADMAHMARLEAVLADPAGMGCAGKVVEGIDLAEWSSGKEALIAEARAVARPLIVPAARVSVRADGDGGPVDLPPLPPPAAAGPDNEGGQGHVSANAQDGGKPLPDARKGPYENPAFPSPAAPESPTAHAEPPPVQDTDFPPGASTRPPRKRRLRVAGGTDIDAPEPEDDADPLPEELSEDALADIFASQHGEDWRCVDAWGKWLHWDGEAWAEDRDHSRVEPMRMLYRHALQTPAGRSLTPDGRRKMGGQARAYASLRYAGTDKRIRSVPEIWDCDPYMLGVPSGVVDLREGKLIESAREQHITMRCSVAPQRGPCPEWLKMLAYWQGGDEDVIGFLRRYLGYAMTGDGREQCMAFFYGPAASGKGTIMRLISYLLGSVPPPASTKFRSYHYEAPISTFLESRNDRHTTELAAMYQKRLITAEEPAAGARWDEAKIKWLTGGSFVTARYMRGDNFSFAMTGKIIVAANHRPRLATTDASIKRRMHVIEFEHPVPDEERDNNLDARLRAEAPQILHWLIEACLEWQQCGLGLPEKIADSTANYLQAEDVLAQWIDEACDRDGDSESKALYQCYCAWAEEQGEKVWSRRAWANALVERGFKTRKGTAGVRMICGLTPRLAPSTGSGYGSDRD